MSNPTRHLLGRILFLCLILSACVAAPQQGSSAVAGRFESLAFLEGRWAGARSDGTAMFLQFDRVDQSTIRVRRGELASAPGHKWLWIYVHGNEIRAQDLMSQGLSWRIQSLTADAVTFQPTYAPVWIRWRRTDPDTLEEAMAAPSERTQSDTVLFKRVPTVAGPSS